ncbi:hypothetical protein [Paenibacillus campi]|uniref:hypothetical protein n=1 Tax=Paenibacillus campi TaxID=3106031 RepID=UPI002AFDDF7A|nr:hypothetical protein [Paenibacillus sp. SGZ-1009]
MLQKSALLIVILCSCLVFPISIFASSVPESVRQSINNELQKQQQEINTFLNQDQQQATEKNHNQAYQLGDGYPVYIIKNATTVPNDAHSANALQFSGYLFIIEGEHGSKALAFAEQAPDYNTITQLSTEQHFADSNFKLPLEQAKKSIGYHSHSKLIYDPAHQVIALVTVKDRLEQVALVKNSTLNHMKQFEVLPFAKFMFNIRQAEAEQAKFVNDTHEPLSGGGSDGGENRLSLSSSWTGLQMLPYLLFGGIAVTVIVVAGLLYYLIYRRRKSNL